MLQEDLDMTEHQRYTGGKVKSGYVVKTVRDENGKEIFVLVEDETAQMAINFIRHNMHTYSLQDLADLIKEKYDLEWNRMTISRIRKDLVSFQSPAKAKRWKGEQSVDMKVRRTKKKLIDEKWKADRGISEE
jgi:hypothetical protein